MEFTPHDTGRSATEPSPSELAKYIDHTLLKPDASSSEIEQLCREAVHWGFKAVCVNSTWTSFVAEELCESDVKVCVVVGFPLGAVERVSKAFEAGRCFEQGAREIDMVLNIGLLKSGEFRGVEEDIRAVRDAIGDATILKVIIETGLLSDDEKRTACELAKTARADYVKTCTGFLGGGASPQDVALMKSVVGTEMGVKASGGIKTVDEVRALIDAGASRIGTSRGVMIVRG